MTNRFELYDAVELREALHVAQGFEEPQPLTLPPGSRGVVVEVFDAEHALVEFPNEHGEALAIEVIAWPQVRLVGRRRAVTRPA